jgi:Nucleotidyl transferase AbiEii toxin, Type IV TA system
MMRDEDVFERTIGQFAGVNGRDEVAWPQFQRDGHSRQFAEQAVGVGQEVAVRQWFATGHEIEVDGSCPWLAAVVVEDDPRLFEHLGEGRIAEPRLAGGSEMAHSAALGAAGLRRQVDDEIVWTATDIACFEPADVDGTIPVHGGVLTARVTEEAGLGEQRKLHGLPPGMIDSGEGKRCHGALADGRLPATLCSMKTKATTLDTIRHRLLEGVLLRLARRPDVGDFILRGGMLLRNWFRPFPRPAEDVDLIATFPFNIDEAAERLRPLLADSISDGVAFDIDRVHIEGIWLDTGTPGARLFTSGTADGIELDFHIDVTFGPYPRPSPVFDTITTASGESARVWMCQPEAVVGQKIQGLLHRGMLGWRPKDLHDLRLLLVHVPMDNDTMRGAITAYVEDLGPDRNARELFGPSSWWGMKMASARWFDFVKSSQGRDAPGVLADAIADITDRLYSILESQT